MEKKVVGVGKMTGDLIVSLLIIGILGSVVSNLVTGFLVNLEIKSMVVSFILAQVLNISITLIICILAVKSATKKSTIEKNNIPKVIRNYFVIFLILLMLAVPINYRVFKKNLDENIEYQKQYLDVINGLEISKFDDEEIKEYNAKINASIEKTKLQSNIYFFLNEFMNLVILVITIPIIKKGLDNNKNSHEMVINDYVPLQEDEVINEGMPNANQEMMSVTQNNIQANNFSEQPNFTGQYNASTDVNTSASSENIPTTSQTNILPNQEINNSSQKNNF